MLALATQEVNCPNCGGAAIRQCSPGLGSNSSSNPRHLICRTECPTCDYLMMMCVLEGALTEVYSPEMATVVEVNRPDIPSLKRYCNDHPDALECRIYED